MATEDLKKLMDRMGATLMEDGSTHCLARGQGNLYARLGMAREFLDRDNATTLSDILTPAPPDDGEEWKQ